MMSKCIGSCAFTAVVALNCHFATIMAADSNKQPTQPQQSMQMPPKGAIAGSTEELSPQEMSSISEAFGNFIGRNLKMPGVKFDLESVVKGMRNGVEGRPAPISDKEYEEKMLKLQKIAFTKLSEENLQKANDFMKQNVKTTNVVEIEPGKLQYLVLEKGHDPVVPEHGRPLIHYTGKYIDGTVFGSSIEMGQPINISLDQTVPGFSKGILGMKEGEKRRLFVHPDLGYGTSGHLPPNMLLVFDIEVIKANSPELQDKDLSDVEEEDMFEDDDLAFEDFEDDNDD